MKVDVESLVVITNDQGWRMYYIRDTDMGLAVPTVAELTAAIKVGTAHDEEWTIDVYRVGNTFYAVTYFNEPQDKDVSLLTLVGSSPPLKSWET